MTFAEAAIIFLITTYRTTYSETFNCDGTNLICAGQPIICTDNEACLITCTGTADCVGTTITCPTNGDCTIECHSGADSGGCKASSITATNSLSLTIDSQDVMKGFQSVPIYCPFNGNCIMSATNSNKAFEFLQVYSIFGFVFNQVSMSCTPGQCNNQMTMYCGNNYASTCTIDTTGNSCENGPSICDTIFTSITNRWNDDYSINPAPGWIVADFNDNSINQTFIGSVNTYHGPFYGDQIAGSLDTYTLTQHFYCANPSYVYVEYTYGFSCQEDLDYSRLYLNDQLYANKSAEVNTGQPFQDVVLEAEVSTQSGCEDKWDKKVLNGSLGEIQANTLFKVQITVTLNYDREASTITDFQIICQPPTNSPTTTPTTSSPTVLVVPTTTSPTTVDPTISPTTPIPTISPVSAAPTRTPTTSVPTVSPVTASPTSITNDPSTSPTMQPTLNTAAPSIEGTRDSDELQLIPKYHTLSTDDVNKEALWIAIGVIGGFCIIIVLISAKIFHKHEKNHRPLYFERTQEMMKESIVGGNVAMDGNQDMLETGNQGYVHDVELNNMSGMNAIDTRDGGDGNGTDGYGTRETYMK